MLIKPIHAILGMLAAIAFIALYPRPALCSGSGGKNCANVNSCSAKAGTCKRIFGGSEFVANNKAPACLDRGAQPCVEVECWVRSYSNFTCSGEPMSDSILPSKGCRRGVVYPVQGSQ